MKIVTKYFTRTAVLLLILLFSSFSESAWAQGMMDPVSFEVTEAPGEVAAGESFEVTIQAQIDGKWHLYSVHNDPDAGPYPTKFSSKVEALTIDGKIEESEPIVAYDPNFDVELGWHASEATFTIPLVFSKRLPADSTASMDVFYQVCDDKSCLPPKTKTITMAVAVSGPGTPVSNTAEVPEASTTVTGGNDDNTGSVSSGETTQKTIAEDNTKPAGQSGKPGNDVQTETVAPAKASTGGEGLFSFLWIAITAGFAALLTPCVYPMIPLTVSYFSKSNEGRQTATASSAITFGVAIVGVFTFMGILLSLLIGASGATQFAANPWVNLFIGGVLLVFALSLLGAFELRLPHQLTNWLNRKSNESSGVIGILFMALTISAVSFACTMPFVSGLLAASSQGQWFYPILGMMAFSAAFASPFVLFALFPGWMESLPQSGSWMNIVKVLLGFIELAAAVKFFSNVDLVWNLGILSRPFAIAIWIAIFLLAGFTCTCNYIGVRFVNNISIRVCQPHCF